MRHRIGLVAHEDALARFAVLLLIVLRILEGITDHTLHARARVNVFLDRHLIGGSLLKHSAQIAVNSLRVFADHDEVDVARLHSFQRTQRRIQQANRAHIGI